MEFSFSLTPILPQHITIITSDSCFQLPHSLQRDLRNVIESLGYASAMAQSLRSSITTYEKILESKDHHLYILKQDGCNNNGKEIVVGMIKVGVKKLFVVDDIGRHLQISPLCVLDFYVHESCQRSGFGKKLFDFMLQHEQELPGRLAFDRPSPKLVGFLKKHFHLNQYTPQANKFLIFKDFGLNQIGQDKRASSLLQQYGQKPAGQQQPPMHNNNLPISNNMEVTISFQKQQPHPTLTPKTVSFAPALNIPSTPVFPEAVYVMDRVNHVESDVKRHMQLDPLSLDELMGKRSISREAKTTNGVNMQNAKLAEIRMKEQRKRDTGRTKPALSSTKDNNNSNFTVNDVKEDGGIPYSIMTPQLIAVAAEPNLNIKKNISCYAPQSFSQVLAPPPSLHQSDHNNSSNTCTDSAFDTSVSPPDPSFSLFSTQYQSQFTHYPKLYQQVQNQLFQTQRFSGGKNYHNPTSLLPIRLEPLSNPMNIPSKMRNAR